MLFQSTTTLVICFLYILFVNLTNLSYDKEEVRIKASPSTHVSRSFGSERQKKDIVVSSDWTKELRHLTQHVSQSAGSKIYT